MKVLVDTSIWVDYFRDGIQSSQLDSLIDEDQILINDLILAELVPFLKIRKENTLVKVLNKIEKAQLIIDWQKIINLQISCLENGMNRIGIPDLIIAQHAIEEDFQVYSLDKHFHHISAFSNLKIFQ